MHFQRLSSLFVPILFSESVVMRYRSLWFSGCCQYMYSFQFHSFLLQIEVIHWSHIAKSFLRFRLEVLVISRVLECGWWHHKPSTTWSHYLHTPWRTLTTSKTTHLLQSPWAPQQHELLRGDLEPHADHRLQSWKPTACTFETSYKSLQVYRQQMHLKSFRIFTLFVHSRSVSLQTCVTWRIPSICLHLSISIHRDCIHLFFVELLSFSISSICSNWTEATTREMLHTANVSLRISATPILSLCHIKALHRVWMVTTFRKCCRAPPAIAQLGIWIVGIHVFSKNVDCEILAPTIQQYLLEPRNSVSWQSLSRSFADSYFDIILDAKLRQQPDHFPFGCSIRCFSAFNLSGQAVKRLVSQDTLAASRSYIIWGIHHSNCHTSHGVHYIVAVFRFSILSVRFSAGVRKIWKLLR